MDPIDHDEGRVLHFEARQTQLLNHHLADLDTSRDEFQSHRESKRHTHRPGCGIAMNAKPDAWAAVQVVRLVHLKRQREQRGSE